MTIYTVQSGDTIYSVARNFGVSASRLIADNGLERPGLLVPGQSLIILTPERTYTVNDGDTLFSIATSNSVSVKSLLRNNPELTQSQFLTPGQDIVISYTDKPRSTRRINGYAYPYISLPLLRRTLPFLSTLTVFGYGFTMSGDVIPPSDDIPLVNAALEYDTAPILLFSSITETGNFDSYRASIMFKTPSLQNKILDQLVGIMKEKGYRGLDIDFEYVEADDADAFLSFITNATDVMHANGFFVNVDLAPKSSADQRGLLYEAHDYPAIGAVADTVLLMTYEWGYTYGPPMAVAPINQVRRIVDYAVTEIPKEKIMMGIPNYGYDWPLPFQKGITKATSIGNQQAIVIAGENGADVEFDELSASPNFEYFAAGTEHAVWFEDARSINDKFGLVDSYDLRGFGYWNIMRPFAQNLSLLSVTYYPEDVNV